MMTNEDLRQQLISTASEFRFDHSRLDATALAGSGQRRRRRRRLLAGALVGAAMATTATVAITQQDESSDSVVNAAGDTYLVPAGTPQGLVLRRSSEFNPRPTISYFNVFYRDGDKRIAIMTVVREGLGSPAAPPTAPPHALATSSGYSFSWRPQSGVEVNVATVGLTQAETEALVAQLGVDAARGPAAYGLLSLPPGFRVVGDEDDTMITGATLSVYAAPEANIADSQSQQPRADVTIGHASDIYREIDRTVFDERASVTIRGHAVDVVTYRANADHGSIVTVSWFEQPGLLVDITAYNMTTGDAIAFARSLVPATFDEWTAHRASARE